MHTSGRFGDSSADDEVTLRPMDLQIASSDGRQKNVAVKSACFIGQRDAVVLNEMQLGGVFGIHQHGIARRAVHGIDFGID